MDKSTYQKIESLIDDRDIIMIKMILDHIDEILELNQIDYFDGLEYIKTKLNLNNNLNSINVVN